MDMNSSLPDSIALRLNDVEKHLRPFYDLHFSQYAPVVTKNGTIILPVLASFLVLLVIIFSFSPSPSPRSFNDNHSDPLEALLTIIAPTSVAWPKEYARLLAHNSSSRTRTISVSMDNLIVKVCDGAVEVRSYADLPDLFSDKLLVYGWRIAVALDTWNLEVLRWSIGSHFSWRQVFHKYDILILPLTSVKTQPELSTGPRRALKRAHGTSIPKEDSSLAPLSFSLSPNTHLDLDYTPFSALESSLLELRATLTPGTSAILEFTTPAAHVTFLSPHFTLCAVPFLPRKHCITSKTPNRTRTATPLLGSLHRVLELLTAGPAALALESASNVSGKYADGLSAAAEHLEENRAARTAFVHRWGVAGWREERLMMAWEAALFSAGHLTRWIVIVRK